MAPDDSLIVAASHVPQKAARKFSALHYSLRESKAQLKPGIIVIFAEGKTHAKVKGIYDKQIKAIQALLTDRFFKQFWEKCSDEQASDFYEVWQSAFNDWSTKPDISKREKDRKIKQAKGAIEKVISIMRSDPSLQREIGIAVTDAVNGMWPQTKNIGDGFETLEVIHAQNFLKSLSDRLGMASKEYYWQSTHRKYPAQIREPHAERDFFVDRFSPIFFTVMGANKHAKLSAFLKKLFPHLSFGAKARDTVRHATKKRARKK